MALAALFDHALAASPIEGQLQAQSATPPQRAIANVIEDICPSGVLDPNGDLQARCTEIVVGAVSGAPIFGGNDVAGAQAGLQGMAPEEDSVLQASQVDTAGASVDAVGERLSNLRAGTAGPTALALTVDGRRATAESFFAPNVGPSGLAAGDMDRLSGWGFFIDAGFATGDKDATANESGFDMDSVLLTLGADYQVSDQLVLGGAFGYTHLEANVDADGGETTSDGYTVLGYLSYYPSADAYIDAVVGYTRTDFDQERNIRYTIAPTVVNQTAFSDTESDEISARITAGLDWSSGDWTYGPYGRLEYARVEIDGFREAIRTSGPGSGLAVAIDDQDFTSLPLALGVRASTTIDTGGATLYPQVFFEYVHEFENDQENITGFFVNDPTQERFFLPTDRPDRDFFNLGVGVSALFDEGLSAHLTYQTLLGHRDITLHAVEAGVRIDF